MQQRQCIFRRESYWVFRTLVTPELSQITIIEFTSNGRSLFKPQHDFITDSDIYRKRSTESLLAAGFTATKLHLVKQHSLFEGNAKAEAFNRRLPSAFIEFGTIFNGIGALPHWFQVNLLMESRIRLTVRLFLLSPRIAFIGLLICFGRELCKYWKLRHRRASKTSTEARVYVAIDGDMFGMKTVVSIAKLGPHTSLSTAGRSHAIFILQRSYSMQPVRCAMCVLTAEQPQCNWNIW